MKINDKRSEFVDVSYEGLIAGNVYTDLYGNYVIACDDAFVVDLHTGTLCKYSDYTIDDMFTPTNASLEIE